MRKGKISVGRMALGLVCALLCLCFTPPALAAGTERLGECAQRLPACDSRGNTNTETDFGNFMADALRWYGDADVALLPSGDLGNHLQQGEITEEKLAFCLQRDCQLGRARISPAQLYAYLEQGVAQLSLKEDETIDWANSHSDGYLQLSGLTVIYDITAPVGERVWELKLADGSVPDREDEEASLTLISTLELLEGGYGYPPAWQVEPLDSELDAAAAYTRHLGQVEKPAGGRTQLMGPRSFWNSNGRVVGGLIAAVGLLLVLSTLDARKRRKQRNRAPWGYEAGAGGSYRDRVYFE